MKAIVWVPSLLIVLGSAPVVILATAADPGAQAAASAARVIAALDESQRAKACFEFKAAERMKWHFVPGIYPGVTLQELSMAQKRGVHGLLLAVLSGAGYQKTTAIMKLEDTLREMAEAQGRQAPHRDPGRYSLSFFGRPDRDAKAPWGFRFQGHHISWNFTSVGGRIVATTPSFLGSNPAEIRQGAHAGYRALPEEEDMARELLSSFSADQTKAAILGDKAPADVLWGPGKTVDSLGPQAGIAWSALSAAQRASLWRLIGMYANNLEADVAAAHLAKIEKAGRSAIHFAWLGSTERGKGHYYRVRGPTFAIEYDNTQNNANHVHTVWHDLTSDFGADPLRKHYAEHHQKK